MTPRIKTLLWECCDGKGPGDAVFTWPVGAKNAGKPIVDFREHWARMFQRANVAPKTVHDMRRTMCSNLNRARVAEALIQKIGGWKTNSMMKRYNVNQTDDQQAAFEEVERLRAKSRLEAAPTPGDSTAVGLTATPLVN
jgi:integrase